MNLESQSSKKPNLVIPADEIEFDFKPITSGLGFHTTSKTTEIKPHFTETHTLNLNQTAMPASSMARKVAQNQIYQNELSIFYGREQTTTAPEAQPRAEKTIKAASSSQRVAAYILDMGIILSSLGIVLTIMARIIHMDLVEVWSAYPGEITPLFLTLFCGFYLMYFSIFEKTTQSTLGKNLLGITVVDLENQTQSITMLMVRATVSLANFISLGLFSYFNLQDKVSNTKVIKVS